MLENELVRGRLYFANGDFYQGRFEKGQLLAGLYTQAGGVKAELKQETKFVAGLPEGKAEVAF